MDVSINFILDFQAASITLGAFGGICLLVAFILHRDFDKFLAWGAVSYIFFVLSFLANLFS